MLEQDPTKLRTQQYATTRNLDARNNLHALYSRHPQGFFSWLFDHYDLPESSHILELGCGAAYQWQPERHHLVDPSWSVTLTDFSAGMLSTARETVSGLGFTFAQNDARWLPFADNTFDRVIANHMLYHLPDRSAAFSEIQRVLRPGGKLFASTNSETSMRALFDLVLNC